MAIYARGTSRWILLADGAFYVVNLLLLVPACKRFGLAGVGSAFFFASCVNFGVAYWVSRRVCSFQFMGLSKRCVAMSVALVGASLLCMTLLPSGFNLLLGGLVAILAALHSLYTFAAIVPGGRLEAIARLAGFNLYGTVKSGIRRHLKNGKGPNV
jgi:O-antigen/teichoic acid export membrane protein